MSVGAQLLAEAWHNNALPWYQVGAEMAYKRDSLIAEQQARSFQSTLEALRISSDNAAKQASIDLQAAHLPVDQMNAETQRMFALERMGLNNKDATVAGGIYGADGKPIAATVPASPMPSADQPALPTPSANALPNDALGLHKAADDNAKLQRMFSEIAATNPDTPVGDIRKSLLDKNADMQRYLDKGLISDPDEIAKTKSWMESNLASLRSMNGLDANTSAKDALGKLQTDYEEIVKRSRILRGVSADGTVSATGAPGLSPSVDTGLPKASPQASPQVAPKAQSPDTHRLDASAIPEGQSVVYPSPTNRSVRISRAGGKLFMETIEVTGKRADGSPVYKSVSTAHEIKEPDSKAAGLKPSQMQPQDVAKVEGVTMLPEGKAAVTYVDRGSDRFKTIIVNQEKEKSAGLDHMSDPDKAALKQATTLMKVLDDAERNKDSLNPLDSGTKASLRARIAQIAQPLIEAHPSLKSLFEPYVASVATPTAPGAPPPKTQAEINAGLLELLRRK